MIQQFFLQDIPSTLMSQLIEKFSTFEYLLDGKTIVFLKLSNEEQVSANDLHIDNIQAFSALSRNPEYFLLEDIQFSKKTNSNQILEDLLKEVSIVASNNDQPIMVTSFANKEKKKILSSLKSLSKEYQFYVMDEKTYIDYKSTLS